MKYDVCCANNDKNRFTITLCYNFLPMSTNKTLNTTANKTYAPLPVRFYERAADTVAVDLLGRLLVRETPQGPMAAKIVEVEAYFGEGDPASHACRGMTPRNAIMFGRAGRAYVYLNYGVHYLLNVVTGEEGRAGAVLLRAVEPLSGIELMMHNRPVKKMIDLTNGPGKLTKALKVDINDNGTDMVNQRGGLFITGGMTQDISIHKSPRIGISAGTDMLLRFSIQGNPYVSR
ncbi:DNA-3-methyladenine glycosylase [Candidatus Aquicultor sp.]